MGKSKTVIAKIEKHNPVFCCEGCEYRGEWTAAGGYECKVYGDNARKMYSRRNFGLCPNNKKFKVKKVVGRVGQQKSKRFKKGV
jgi:hypothetical protein